MELIKTAMHGMLMNEATMKTASKAAVERKEGLVAEIIAEWAIEVADTIIRQLEEKED
jgi:hypothetical protein